MIMPIQNLIYLFLAMLFFAVIHSLTAGNFLRKMLAGIIGERASAGWYRIFYNLVSVLTLLPVGLLMVLLPDRNLYQVGFPFDILMRFAQILSVGGAGSALISTDIGRFIGLSQIWEHFRAVPLKSASDVLRVDGLYRVVRHPLYLFSLTFLWFSPGLTWNGLSFNVAATLYFVIGSLVEEKRLEKQFGDTYRSYRKTIPWLFPIRLVSAPESSVEDQGTM